MARNRRELSRGSWLRRMDASGAADRETLAAQLAPHELAALGSYYWEGWARDEQLPPQDRARDIWRTWLICAGRGFGKTRAGAEWIRDVARNDGAARIALIGASLAEVRSVMVEGDSGILAAAPGALAPVFEPSLKRLTWENGAQAFLYSAAEPESLRGPQHSHAWCDEIAKWDNASDRAMTSWNNLQLTMRLGKTPRVLATTTPRNAPLMRLLLADAKRGKVVVARGPRRRTSRERGSRWRASCQNSTESRGWRSDRPACSTPESRSGRLQGRCRTSRTKSASASRSTSESS